MNNTESTNVFRNYSKEKLSINSIYSRLTVSENAIRKNIMEYIISHGKSFNVKEDSVQCFKDLKLSTEEVKANIMALQDKLALVMDEEENVNYIYPVCAVPTNHRVTLGDGRKFYAMCAVDAMGTAFTFKQDVQIQSVCSECGEEAQVQIKEGKITNFSPAELRVLHVDLNNAENWAGSC